MRNREGQARSIDNDEFQRVIDCANKHSQFPARDCAILCVSYYTGLRVCEIAGLDWEDIIDARLELKRTVVLRKLTTKMNKGGVAYFTHPQLREALERHIVQIRSNNSTSCASAPKFTGALFLSRVKKRFSPNSLSRLFTTLYQKAGLEGATGYTGRRSLARNLNRSGVSIYNIKNVLRHSNIQTTVRYIDVDTDLLADIVGGI